MKRFFSIFSAIVMLFCFTTAANALTLTVRSNITYDTIVGGTLSGSFDINSSVPGGGTYYPSYNILSATARFNFRDDGDLVYLNGTYGSFVTSPSDPYRSDRRIDVYYSDAPETAQATIGGQVASVSTSYNSFIASEITVSTSCAVSGPSGICYKHKYARTSYNTHVSGYGSELAYGGRRSIASFFNLSQTLGASALADLSADGIIDFSISALIGDFKFLRYSSLVLELAPNPVVSPPSVPAYTAVPEPSTLLLLGSGLVGLGFVRRRFKA